jgi:transposase-like protein
MNRTSKYSEDFKRETLRLYWGGQTLAQIKEGRGVVSSVLHRWKQQYPEEARANGNGANGAADKRPHANSKHLEKKAELDALIAGGMKVSQAAKQVGVPVATVYGWRLRARKEEKAQKKAAKKGGAVVVHKGQPVEATKVSPDGMAALITAAEKALINLKQARRIKLELIQGHVPGADQFSDDFCHGQIAYNALARAFGMK